jgi:hypothetical protein
VVGEPGLLAAAAAAAIVTADFGTNTGAFTVCADNVPRTGDSGRFLGWG